MVTPDYEGEENANQMSVTMVHRDEHHREGSAKKVILTNKWGKEAFAQMPPLSYVNHFVGVQTNTVLITPNTGKKLRIYGIHMDSDIISKGEALINFVNVAGTLVWNAHFEKARAPPGWTPINILGGVNENLILNTTGFSNSTHLFVGVAYDEVD